jgi:hypothetical protein
MTTKNAERQAKYRQKHLKDENGTLSRLDLMLDFQAKLRLERLASCYRVTQREMLERLLAQHEAALTAAMPGDQVDLYYDKKLTGMP